MEQMTTIYQKDEIIQGLSDSFREVRDLVNQISNEQFLMKTGPKWSIAENLDHLIRSTKGLGAALKTPKVALLAFGVPKRPSRDFQGLVDKYNSKLAIGGAATGPYVPEKNSQFDQAKMLANWSMIGEKFNKRLSSWNEKNLDKYLLPHPLLGKLTIREMMFFTIHHNGHHLRSMKGLI